MKQEEINPYREGDKTQQVEEMFDNIAPTYDKLNHHLSLNIDKDWRKQAIGRLKPYRPKTVLDVATGTADLAIQAAQTYSDIEHITAIDISEGMMQVGREKVEKLGLQQRISFDKQDCLALDYPENSFDAVISAFGIRNFANLEKGLSEMHRVLKKGGFLCILELTKPESFLMKQNFSIYSHKLMPLYGKFVSGDKSAYDYLAKTIDAFPQGERLVDMLKTIGFKNAAFKRLTFGICTLITATK